MGNLQSSETKSGLISQNSITEGTSNSKPELNQAPATPSTNNNNNNTLKSALKSSTDQLRSNLKRSHDRKQDPSWLTYWVAARTGNLDKLKYYVEELNQKVNEKDEYGNTAMYYCCLCHHAVCLEYLLEHGATIEGIEGERCWLVANLDSIRDLLRGHNSSIGKSGKNNAFFAACWSGDVSSVQNILRDQEFSVNTRSRYGFYGLDYATFRNHTDLENVLRTKHGAYRSLVSDMKKLVYEGLCSDITWRICDLEGKERIICLHKIVLSARLKNKKNVQKLFELGLLEAAGENNFVTKGSSKDIILNYEVAMELVEYIYCGTVRGSTMFSKELATLADCLNFKSFHETLSNSRQSRDYKSLQVCESLGKDFLKCVNNKALSDITFNVQGTVFYAHKAILCARSDYFKALFFGTMSQSAQTEQIIDDVTPEVFKLLLEYLYTDTIENISEKVTADNALDLIPLANRWLMEPLKVFCETILCTEFSVDPIDATTLYVFAEEHNCISFKRMCLKVMQTNAAVAIESDDFELLPEEIQTRLQRIKEGKKISADKPKKTNNNNNQPKLSNKAPKDVLGNPLKKNDKVQLLVSQLPPGAYYTTSMPDGWTQRVGLITGFSDGLVRVAMSWGELQSKPNAYKPEYVRKVTEHSPNLLYL